MPARSDAAAMRDPAWLDAYERRGWAVTALDPTAAVIDHVALITSPPDGRYSPLGGPRGAAGMQQQQQDGEAEGAQQAGWVRALVLPLDEAAPQPAEPEVELAGFLPSGVRLFSKKMQAQQAQQAAAAGGGGLLFAAQGETTVSCVSARTGGPAAECYPPADQALIQVGGPPRGGVVGAM